MIRSGGVTYMDMLALYIWTVLYLLVAGPKERAETIEQLREALVHIIHSK